MSIPRRVLKNLFKFGVPFSFVYCTIYQQDIWREGDERLFLEQKRTWRNFFAIIDNGYHITLSKLNIAPQSEEMSGLISKFDSLDVRNCWNTMVGKTFGTIDMAISNPKAIACKVYRKIQPYISPPKVDKIENVSISETAAIVKTD